MVQSNAAAVRKVIFEKFIPNKILLFPFFSIFKRKLKMVLKHFLSKISA
jgi:hypothetical protein